MRNLNEIIQKSNILPLELEEDNGQNVGFCKFYKKDRVIGMKSPLYEDCFLNDNLDIQRKILLNGRIWYRYPDEVYISEMQPNDSLQIAECVSMAHLSFAPGFMNGFLNKIIKNQEIPVLKITSRSGKSYVIVDVKGNEYVRKTISINLK